MRSAEAGSLKGNSALHGRIVPGSWRAGGWACILRYDMRERGHRVGGDRLHARLT